MGKKSTDGLTFNGCWFCPEKQQLYSESGTEIPIRNQAIRVFQFLAKKPNHTISSEELESSVWRDVVVTRDSLHHCISEIRQAIDDHERRVLRTVHRRGYQLVPDKVLEVSKHVSAGEGAIDSLSAEIFCVNSVDGTRVAWREIGQGIPLLKAPNWIADVDMAAGNQAYSPFYVWLASRYRFIRFDQRGTGLSDRNVSDLSIDLMVEDMDAVASAAGIERFFLLGASQGAAYSIAYAHKYPEKVLGLIFRGGMVVGPGASGDPAFSKWLDTARTVVKNGWDSGDHAYRRYFSSRIAADASVDVLRDLDELQRLSVSAEMVIRIFEFLDQLDLQHFATQVGLPTLIMHSKDDVMVPYSESRRLHRLMPHARFVTLEGVNHAVLPDTIAFKQVCQAMESFTSETDSIASDKL